jgi:hypothetical protein
MGKLRMKWLEDVVSDLRELQVKRWKEKDNTRYGWTSVIKVSVFL